MKIIVDTNVLVSAVLKGREPREVVQFIIDNKTCKWIVSEEILAEYKEVLSLSKFKLNSEVRLQWLEILDTVKYDFHWLLPCFKPSSHSILACRWRSALCAAP